MASIPFPELSLRPIEQPDLLGQYGKVVALKGMLQQQQFQQQMQPMQLQQAQTQAQLQQFALQEQKTLMNLAPQYVKKDDQGQITGFDNQGYINGAMSSGKVSPAKLIEMQNQQVITQKNMADAGTATLNLKLAQNKDAYETMEGVRSAYKTDPTTAEQSYQNGLTSLTKQGIDTSRYPQSFTGFGAMPGANGDPMKGLNTLEAGFGMQHQQLTDASTIADTREKNAKAQVDELKASQAQSPPGAFDSVIDQIAPPTVGGKPGPLAALNARTKASVNEFLLRHDYDGAKTVLDAASNDVSSMERQRVQLSNESYNRSLDREAASYNAQQVRGSQLLTQAWTDPQRGYTEVQAQTALAQKALANAKDGNEFAAAMSPLMTTLGINGFEGMKRVPPAEAKASTQFGSLFRQANTILDKVGTGSVPADSLKEMNQVLNEIRDLKYQQTLNNSQFIMRNYRLDPATTPIMDANGNMTTLSGGQAGPIQPYVSRGGKVQKAAPPAGAPPTAGPRMLPGTGKTLTSAQIAAAAQKNNVSVDEATRQAQQQGYKIQD